MSGFYGLGAGGKIGPKLKDRYKMRYFGSPFDVSNEFVQWVAANRIPLSPKSKQSKDIFIDIFASRRFSIGIDDDASFVFGIPELDSDPFVDINWTSIAIARRYHQADWVVLSSRDIRQDPSWETPVAPIRLWFSVLPHITDIFQECYDSGALAHQASVVLFSVKNQTPSLIRSVTKSKIPFSFI